MSTTHVTQSFRATITKPQGYNHKASWLQSQSFRTTITKPQGYNYKASGLQSQSFRATITKPQGYNHKASGLQSQSFRATITKPQGYNYKASGLQLQSFTYKASVHSIQIPPPAEQTATSAHTWIKFQVSSQKTLLTENLGDYIIYHILGINWAS
ncbi:hypothetical protein ACFX1X_017360 [Malus domestica]